MIFVDLQKYKTLGKPLNKGANKIADLWLKFLTEIDDYTIDADPQLLDNPETSEALEIVEQAAYSAQELEAYNKYWLDISTERSALLEYEEKGRVEGREEGREEGRRFSFRCTNNSISNQYINDNKRTKPICNNIYVFG